MRPNRSKSPEQDKRRALHQKNFEIEVESKTASDLLYFVRQELEYYNCLVDKLTPRLRAYPKDLLSIKDREKKLWDACAEHAIDPQKLLDHPLEEWPKHLHHLYSLVYEPNGTSKILPVHVNIIGIAAAPARLHSSVRRSMSSEVLKYMLGQADVFLAGMKTETLRVPMQMLQIHTIDTKRHLQIPRNLIKITYNEDSDSSNIILPYSKSPLIVPHVDLREHTFKAIILRAPHPTSSNNKWQLDLKDTYTNYLLNVTDNIERKRRL